MCGVFWEEQLLEGEEVLKEGPIDVTEVSVDLELGLDGVVNVRSESLSMLRTCMSYVNMQSSDSEFEGLSSFTAQSRLGINGQF